MIEINLHENADGSLDGRYRLGDKPSALLFSDSFDGYSVIGDAVSGQWSSTYSEGSGSIGFAAYPPEPAKQSLEIAYVAAEDIDTLTVNLPANKRHLFFQWRESRSAGFDFGPTKDWRVTCNGGSGLVDLYFLIGNLSSTTGVDDADKFYFNNQGAAQGSPVGDPNIYLEQPITFNRSTDYKIEIELKLNSDTNSDAEFRVWLDDVLLGELTNFKILPDGFGSYNLDNFSFGMVASNYGQAFAGESKIYRTDFKVSETRIS